MFELHDLHELKLNLKTGHQRLLLKWYVYKKIKKKSFHFLNVITQKLHYIKSPVFLHCIFAHELIAYSKIAQVTLYYTGKHTIL